MTTETNQHWTRTVALGVTLVLFATVVEVVVVNIAGALVPLFTPRDLDDMQASIAAMRLGMVWVGVIPVIFAVPLIIGVWKGTHIAALETDERSALFRNSMRILVVAYSLALTVRAVCKFFLEREDLVEIRWVQNAIWWVFVLLSLEYVRRLFLRLDRDKLASQTRVVAIVYVALVAVTHGFTHVMQTMLPDMTGSATMIVTAVIGLIVLVLLGGVLLKLRGALLAHQQEHGHS